MSRFYHIPPGLALVFPFKKSALFVYFTVVEGKENGQLSSIPH